jgi:hypothetical protein
MVSVFLIASHFVESLAELSRECALSKVGKQFINNYEGSAFKSVKDSI